jgi:hypothetical protein
MMRALLKLFALVGVLAAAACNKSQPPPQQNITIADNSTLANADVETLPPDESVGTPSNQLVNGTDNPDVNYSTNSGD